MTDTKCWLCKEVIHKDELAIELVGTRITDKWYKWIRHLLVADFDKFVCETCLEKGIKVNNIIEPVKRNEITQRKIN